MAYSSNIVKTKRDGTVKIITGAPTTYIANFAVGDFTWTHAKPELLVIYDRATIAGARSGNDQTIEGSFTLHLRALHDNANEAVIDLIANGTLAGGAQASTGGSGYEPTMYTVEFTIDATSLGDSKTYVATFSKCQLNFSVTEGDTDSLAVTFTAVGGVAYT